MTRLQRACLLVAAASLLAMLGLAAVADSHSPQSWTVPPSAIVAITTAPGAQWMTPSSVSASMTAGALPTPDSGYEPATASPRLPRWSAEPKPVMELGRVTMPASPTPGAAASHSLAELVRTGTASFYDAGPGLYAALPGPWRAGRWANVCGPARCVRAPIVTSCVCGSHVIDLSPQLWEAVAGMNTAERWRYGVTSVSLVIEGRAS